MDTIIMDTTNIAKETNNKVAFIKNNEVINCVIVSKDANESFLNDLLNNFQADIYIILDESTNWVGVNCHYINNQFVGPKPHKSWTWGNNEWVAPIEKPEGDYYWSESLQQWIPSPTE